MWHDARAMLFANAFSTATLIALIIHHVSQEINYIISYDVYEYNSP